MTDIIEAGREGHGALELYVRLWRSVFHAYSKCSTNPALYDDDKSSGADTLLALLLGPETEA
jgi:hypothetical protein